MVTKLETASCQSLLQDYSSNISLHTPRGLAHKAFEERGSCNYVGTTALQEGWLWYLGTMGRMAPNGFLGDRGVPKIATGPAAVTGCRPVMLASL